MVHPKEEARVRVQVDVVKVKESLLIPKLLILIKINTMYLIVNINTILRVIVRGLLIITSVTNIVKVREGKESVATREPDLKKELKRGSMKEKWGLTLVHRTGEGNRIELGVSKVGKFFS